MAKHLVIVESPAKCKTISKYLGKDFSVRASMGHVIDLPEKELGVDLEHDFKPKYTTSKGKQKILKELKSEASKVEDVFLAPDPDREGEAIAWHIAESIREENANVKRVMFNEITKRAVLQAFDFPHDIDTNKVNAQQARRILDRIVGYQVSPILWRTVFKGLSAGRVQSVALRLICEREEEIGRFVQKEYWSLQGKFEYSKTVFGAKLLSVDGKKGDADNPLIPDGTTAAELIKRLKDVDFTVTDVARSEKVRKPYPPFITSTLQQEASKKLGFTAAKTMMVAQQLYEGLELGHLGSLGLITYMRTDSTRIAQEAVADARKVIGELYGDKHLPSAPRVYGKNKNAQDAHEAIRPSQVNGDFHPDRVKGYLSKDQFRLYELIWKRFLASQMENAIFDSTRVDISGDNCVFRANGSILKFDGFLALYDETVEDNTESEGDERLPDLQKNVDVNLKQLIDKQHFTQPPPRYTEASLVHELEDKGIGRPSTYAQIIDTLKRRKYVMIDSKRFVPSEVGFMVKDILVKEFSDVFDVGFTADMENSLDKVELGDADWVAVLKDFYGPFSGKLANVKLSIKDLRARNQEVTDRTCPSCKQHPLVIKWSRNGKFLACQGFPDCKYTEPLEKTSPVETSEVCDKCGAPMVMLSMNGSRFLGCSRYPECKCTRSITTGIKCPEKECEGQLVERKTKRGKPFYGCSKFPKCTFAVWDRPINETCEKCGCTVMVVKESKRKGTIHKCPSCNAEKLVAPPADESAGSSQSASE
ncbi:MAG TPA: type I DNA topoisomerase [Chitinispirillaceae bacterium]|nr:type I DNA topoisomerase [Chitinispirillaceae bacterium]